MKDQIINALSYFQQAYIDRDSDKIDEFMDRLFIKDKLIIFGTGINEVCINDEQSKELFTSDWKYWGDYRLNFDSLHIKEYPSFSYAEIEGTLTYKFFDDDKTYDKFVGYVRENMDLGSHYDFMDVMHYLSHLLHPRDQKERAFELPIVTSFIFVENDNDIKINRIIFSMMNLSLYKDIRFEDVIPYTRAFARDVELMKSLGCQSSYLLSNLTFDEDNIVRNHQGVIFKKNIGEGIQSCFLEDDELTINEESLVNYTSNEHHFITCYATLRRQTTQEELENKLKKHILTILDSDIKSKDKLFKVRRDIALTYKEIALGLNFTWPIRIHGIIQSKDEKWVIKHINIVDPFNVILEDK